MPDDFIVAGLDRIQAGVFVPRLSGKPLQESNGLRGCAKGGNFAPP
jgi:hypothetical protein